MYYFTSQDKLRVSAPPPSVTLNHRSSPPPAEFTWKRRIQILREKISAHAVVR